MVPPIIAIASPAATTAPMAATIAGPRVAVSRREQKQRERRDREQGEGVSRPRHEGVEFHLESPSPPRTMSELVQPTLPPPVMCVTRQRNAHIGTAGPGPWQFCLMTRTDRSDDEPSEAGYTRRYESDAQRLDRNWSSLLQELRVVQTGVQLLTGFLMTLPFQPGFTALSTNEKTIY